MVRCGILLLLIGTFAISLEATAQGVLTQKDEIYEFIENCEPSRSREAVAADPHEPLTVTCRNKCMESKLNDWLSQSPENRERYFASGDVYEIERAAWLASCREGGAIVEQTRCMGQYAPDILRKAGPIPCGEAVMCDVRFDIDDNGRPEGLSAACQPGPAQAEYEREAICLIGTMSYPSHRGRKNVVQPFEMKSDLSCPIS